jgi:hypothetical protein
VRNMCHLLSRNRADLKHLKKLPPLFWNGQMHRVRLPHLYPTKPCGEKTYMSDEWVCDRYKCVAVFSHHS